MTVRILDLQLIYGVAGAREMFEKMVLALVHGENDSARGMEAKQGDGGIDVYLGTFTGPLDVFQTKFFPIEIKASQQKQIRESFKTVNSGQPFKVRSWTLCIPKDMTKAEAGWFDDWKAKQEATTGVTIEKPWTASKLESLLMQDKNKGIKEEFFKHEYLTQIREVHELLTELLADFSKRSTQIEETHVTVQKIADNLESLALPMTFVPLIEGLTFLELEDDTSCLRYLKIGLNLVVKNTGQIAIPRWMIKFNFKSSLSEPERYVAFPEHDAIDCQDLIYPRSIQRTTIPFWARVSPARVGIAIGSEIQAAFRGLIVDLTPSTQNNVGDTVTHDIGQLFDRAYIERALQAFNQS